MICGGYSRYSPYQQPNLLLEVENAELEAEPLFPMEPLEIQEPEAEESSETPEDSTEEEEEGCAINCGASSSEGEAFSGQD